MDQDTTTDNVMSQADRNSESSRLVSPNATTRPSYLNILSNLLSLIFVGIITYCSFLNGITLFSFHPPLMAIGWLIIMTSAINAITPGDLATEWMPIRLRSARHWVLQLFGAILIAAGFLVIMSNKIINNKPHFGTLHAKFGLSSLIFMVGTMLGGIGALYSLKLKHYLPPIYTKLIHASVGLVTFSLGIATISCGLFSDWFAAKGEILQYTALVMVILVLLFTILRPSLKVYFRLRERLDNVN
ncbi:transmembrane reductase CYB561D2 [Amyelois transitella]|uniref:transmembrane reductase CYB561D2 n=1 Tax=Amyelois transitella TaxID=680683 RepID=UPI00067DC7D2|nr:transmembrane reductase CYB561D2 [Amyelois transitella]XP_013185955.1 transmembrane reductase CYB561D2 [Amyelois transitella]XP_013185956.1 transmembrane reductase CYB561D2 [Amyelois transitella]